MSLLDRLRAGGHFRWWICGLLFAGTALNYMDRQVLGLLAPLLEQRIGWTEIQYGYLVTAFQLSYAAGLPLFGWIVDRWGTKRGYALSVTAWSLAVMLHAAARGVMGFGLARAFLGLGEAGNFPSAIKAVAEWFPRRDRALATGVFNSGANIGAVIAPALLPWITVRFGWQACFLLLGVLGFLWLGAWLALYALPEQLPALSDPERAHIASDPPEAPGAKVPWSTLLRHRQTWAFIAGKFLTDPIWWFYLYWLPKFFARQHGLSLLELGLPLVAIYTLSSAGSIAGGWLAQRLARAGWELGRARRVALLVPALCVVPIFAAGFVASLWGAVALVGLAAAGHQAWSANLFSFASDLMPKRALGTAVGLGGMAGSLGGTLLAVSAGYLITATGSYLSLFLLASSAYLAALALMTLLVPRMQPLEL